MAVADWRCEAALPTAGVRECEAFEHTVARGLGNRRRHLSLSEPPTGGRRKCPNRRYASCRSSGEPPRNSSLPARVLTNWASPKVAMTSHSRISSPNQPERFIATRYHGGVDKDRPIPGGALLALAVASVSEIKFAWGYGAQGKAPLAREAVGNNPTDRKNRHQTQLVARRNWRPALAYRQRGQPA